MKNFVKIYNNTTVKRIVKIFDLFAVSLVIAALTIEFTVGMNDVYGVVAVCLLGLAVINTTLVVTAYFISNFLDDDCNCEVNDNV